MGKTTVIVGGMVADGTGAALRKADVAVQDGRIVAIGESLSGDEVLDATGAIVAPGFIDIHTHYDAQLFWDPACTPSSWHGVTSIVIGNCGFALAPARPENRDQLVRMLVELEDMPASVLQAGIDWSFTDFAGYLASIAALKPSLNIAAYVGHSPIRIDVMGPAAYERSANDEEIAAMAAIVREAMAAGAIGFATSSAPSGRRSPTGKADERELIALGRAMGARASGVMAMVPGGASLSRERLYEIQPEIGRPVTWTALLTMPDGSHHASAALHREYHAKGAPVHPQVSCRPQVAMTTMRGAFTLRTPSMFALEGCTDAERIAAYRNPEWRAKMASEMDGVRFPVTWDRWEITDSPSAPELIGKTMEEAALLRRKNPLELLFDLVLADDLDTRFTVTQFNYAEADVAELLNMEGAVLGLADSGAHPDQICDAVLPTDLLGNWVREKRVLSIEKAVRKLSGEIADLMGLDRGYLRAGAPADITVFDPATIASGPLRRVRDMPANGERLIADQTIGLRHMLVNGVLIRRDGVALPRNAQGGPGQILRAA